jgi:hypothetical protein
MALCSRSNILLVLLPIKNDETLLHSETAGAFTAAPPWWSKPRTRKIQPRRRRKLRSHRDRASRGRSVRRPRWRRSIRRSGGTTCRDGRCPHRRLALRRVAAQRSGTTMTIVKSKGFGRSLALLPRRGAKSSTWTEASFASRAAALIARLDERISDCRGRLQSIISPSCLRKSHDLKEFAAAALCGRAQNLSRDTPMSRRGSHPIRRQLSALRAPRHPAWNYG